MEKRNNQEITNLEIKNISDLKNYCDFLERFSISGRLKIRDAIVPADDIFEICSRLPAREITLFIDKSLGGDKAAIENYLWAGD